MEPANCTQDEVALPEEIEPMMAMIADAPFLAKGMARGRQVTLTTGAQSSTRAGGERLTAQYAEFAEIITSR